jgi:hypothetical protein
MMLSVAHLSFTSFRLCSFDNSYPTITFKR